MTTRQQRPATRQGAQRAEQEPNRAAGPPAEKRTPPPSAPAATSQSAEERTMEYTPLGENAPIKLTIDMVRRFLCTPTKSGKLPDDPTVVQYMMVCRQRRLNPWVGDCYLLGYDTNNGPKFSIVVAAQALFKRAEISEHFDGVESGVVVQDKASKEVIERAGDLYTPGEELLGGWACVYRRDRKMSFYQRLNLSVYDKGTPQWRSDPAGMIVKCAEVGALRQAFPSDIGGLYLDQEMHEWDGTKTAPVGGTEGKPAATAAAAGGGSTAAQLKNRLQPKASDVPQAAAAAAGGAEPAKEADPAGEAAQAQTEAPGEHDQRPADEVAEAGQEPDREDLEDDEESDRSGDQQRDLRF